MAPKCVGDTDGDGNCAFPLCPACHPENRPSKKSRRAITRGRRFRIFADLGSGKKEDVCIHCTDDGITVWKYRKHKRHWLSWSEVAGLVARRSQLKAAQRALNEFERSPE